MASDLRPEDRCRHGRTEPAPEAHAPVWFRSEAFAEDLDELPGRLPRPTAPARFGAPGRLAFTWGGRSTFGQGLRLA